jgi:hypothetical protein
MAHACVRGLCHKEGWLLLLLAVQFLTDGCHEQLTAPYTSMAFSEVILDNGCDRLAMGNAEQLSDNLP